MEKGDVITWKNHMHHCGSNSGMEPKMTMNITGIVNKNRSIKQKNFSYIKINISI